MLRISMLATLIVAGTLLAGCGSSPRSGGGADAALSEVNGTVDFWATRLGSDSSDFVARARLGIAQAQRARLGGDVTDYARAAENLGIARAAAPGDVDTMIRLGFARAALHDFAGSLDLAEAALELEPSNAATHALKGDALLALGRYSEVGVAYVRAAELAPGLETTARLAQYYAATGDERAATNFWRDALESVEMAPDGDAAWALTEAGRYSLRHGDLQSADQRFERALQRVGGYAPAVAGRADVRAARGDIDEAIATYESLVARQPNVDFVTTLIGLYERAGMEQKADEQRAVVRGIDALYRDAGVNNDLAMARFHVKHGDADRGLALARAAYQAAPTWEAASVLSAAHYRLGDADPALVYGRTAVEINPASAAAHLGLAMALELSGDRRGAAAHAAKALAINPYVDGSGLAVRLVAAHLVSAVLG